MNGVTHTRFARLDGLRGLAAAGVMLHHIFFFFHPWQFAAFPLAWLAGWFHRFGWTMVDLFFVLSGFVFAHTYLQDENLRTRQGMAAFWIARIARLWPLHLTMLVLIAALGPASRANTIEAFVAQLFMLQAFVKPVAGTFDWSSWSLTIEVFCYAVFCVAYSHGRIVLLWTTGIMIVLALVGFAEFGHSGGAYAGSVFRRGLLGFFMGQALWHARGPLGRIPAIVLAGGVLAGFLMENGADGPAVPLTLLAWPCVLLLTLRCKQMEWPAMVWLGDRSYAIYLINLPLIQMVVRLTRNARLDSPHIVAVQLAIVAAVLLAANFAFRLIEAPSRRAIRHQWSRHKLRMVAKLSAMPREYA